MSKYTDANKPRAERRSRALTYVAIAAVQDRLVAAAVLADSGERVDDAQAELLALLALVDGDVLDVADAAEPAQELALDEHAADAHDAVRRAVNDDDGVVCAWGSAESVELCAPRLLARVGDDGQDAEHVEVPAAVVCGRERAQL